MFWGSAQGALIIANDFLERDLAMSLQKKRSRRRPIADDWNVVVRACRRWLKPSNPGTQAPIQNPATVTQIPLRSQA